VKGRRLFIEVLSAMRFDILVSILIWVNLEMSFSLVAVCFGSVSMSCLITDQIVPNSLFFG